MVDKKQVLTGTGIALGSLLLIGGAYMGFREGGFFRASRRVAMAKSRRRVQVNALNFSLMPGPVFTIGGRGVKNTPPTLARGGPGF